MRFSKNHECVILKRILHEARSAVAGQNCEVRGGGQPKQLEQLLVAFTFKCLDK